MKGPYEDFKIKIFQDENGNLDCKKHEYYTHIDNDTFHAIKKDIEKEYTNWVGVGIRGDDRNEKNDLKYFYVKPHLKIIFHYKYYAFLFSRVKVIIDLSEIGYDPHFYPRSSFND